MPGARGFRLARSSPTRATTRSSSRSRNCSTLCAAFWRGLRRRVDLRLRCSDEIASNIPAWFARALEVPMLTRINHDLTMAEAARNPGGSRVDLLVVAGVGAPRREGLGGG